MKTTLTNWFCKTFPGFYESFLYNSDTLHDFEYGETPDGYCWEFINKGFSKFEKSMCEHWVDSMRDSFEDNLLDMKIGKLVDMWSPREYNFSTDRITFQVEVNLNELKKWCWETKKDDFNKFLNDHFTSCDGFWSFTPNNLCKFKRDYKEHDSKDNLIDVMLEYYILQNINFDDVLNDTMDYQWECIMENVALQKTDDWTYWDYEYTDGGYKATTQIKEIA